MSIYQKIINANLFLTIAIATCFSSSIYAQQLTKYTYDDAGNMLTTDGPRTDVEDITTYTYDDNGYRNSITNALDHIIQLLDHDGRGQPQRMIDANGIETIMTYHVRGWLASITIVDPSGDPSLNSVTQYGYDAIGQMTSTTLPDGTQLTYTYDAARRLTQISNNLGESIQYTLDNAGNRLKETIRSDNNEIVYTIGRTYDEMSRVMEIIGAEGQTTHLDYDANANNTLVTNPRDYATDQIYDPLDRLSQTIDAEGGITRFRYNAQDQITQVTDANGHTTRYRYDAFGNVIRTNSPDTGVTTYLYDDANNRIRMTDSRGVVVNYRYDALNRLISARYPSDPSANVTYQYDNTDNGNYGIGRLTRITDASGRTDFHYDHRGNLLSQTGTLNGRQFVTRYQYTLNNRPSTIIYPSGLQLTLTYDTQGRLQAIQYQSSESTTPTSVVSNITYLPFGPVRAMDYGNGLTTTWRYNQDYQLTHLTTQSLSSRSYRYDANGNIVTINTSNQEPNQMRFRFDPLDRLTQARNSAEQLIFDYDAVGNRLSRQYSREDGNDRDTYHYADDSNQLYSIDRLINGHLNSIGYDYDNAGNPIEESHQGETDQYEYGVNNRLTTVTTADAIIHYTYNSLGQRTQKTLIRGDTTNTTYYLYGPAGQLQAEADHTGQVTREYLYADGQLVATWVMTPEAVDDEAIVYVINSTGLKLRPADASVGSPMITAEASDTSNWVRYRQVMSNNGYFYLQNLQTGMYFRPIDNAAGSDLEQQPSSSNGNRTQWSLTQADDNHDFLVNRWSGLHIGATSLTPEQPVKTRSDTQTGSWARWQLTPVPPREFYLVNKGTGLKLRPSDASVGSQMITTEASDTSNWVRYRQVMGNDGYFYLQNLQTGMYFRPTDSSVGSGLEQQPSSRDGNRTQWSLATADDDHYFLINRWSGHYVGATSRIPDRPATTRLDTQTGSWNRWQLTPATEATGTLYYTHNDHLGTPRILTDQSQDIVWEAHYTPFGEATIITNIVENNIRFPGQYFDEETKLHYNWYRYYDPSLGRYIQSDPIGPTYDFSDPKLVLSIKLGLVDISESLNNNILNHNYVYSDNRPVIKSDPYGLFGTGFQANWLNSPPQPGEFIAPRLNSPGESCSSRCFKAAALSAYRTGIRALAGAVFGGAGAGGLLSYYGGLAGGLNSKVKLYDCLHKCQKYDCPDKS